MEQWESSPRKPTPRRSLFSLKRDKSKPKASSKSTSPGTPPSSAKQQQPPLLQHASTREPPSQGVRPASVDVIKPAQARAVGGHMDPAIYRATTTAPVNIAVIKYWGKRDSHLNLPSNSSLSVTLNQRDLCTLTTASCSPKFQNDTLTLNNVSQPLDNVRTQACFRELRLLRHDLEAADPSLPALSTFPLRINSSNNFPTAAGLASSAAGFAALVRAIADLYELHQPPEQLSRIARQGSGSACRSLFGGYTAWHMGVRVDGSDSMAAAVAPVSHWPSMRALILVISDAKKDVSSTAGMQATVATSSLFATRAADVVPQRMGQMVAAIEHKDFSTFAFLTMRESNSFHATCADTWPPIFYLTDTSRAAIRVVEAINAAEGQMVTAYTFDAGPNAVIFFEEKHQSLVLATFRAIVGHVPGWPRVDNEARATTSYHAVQTDANVAEELRAGVSRVIMTSVGEGPRRVQDHLVDGQGNLLRKEEP
ncbi:MAG: hypothetical protein Q9162_001881 [Coniocarpon cinnabarinum]